VLKNSIFKANHAKQRIKQIIFKAAELIKEKPKTENCRVAIIEDERDLREDFRSMEDALRNVEQLSPDLVLTDIGLPNMDGIEGTRILREKFPDLPIIVLTVHDENDKIFKAICAGANGYLLKNKAPNAIIEAINDVLNGGSPMSPSVATRVVNLFRKFAPPERSEIYLTDQEKKILKMLTEGHHYKTIAYELGISNGTVSFHIQNIYQKLQVHSKTEAVAKALRENLV
jgi:DNA-binding NarL/FixJ family response regulator